MSKIQVNDIVNHYDTGAPQFPKGIAVGSGATLGLNVGTGASIYSPSDNVLTLGTNSTERVRITGIGSVGIGQADPQGDLHIGNISGSKNIIMHSANNGNARVIFREGGSTASGFNEYSIGMVGNRNAITINGQGAGEIISIMGDTGLVGIGTNNPNEELHIHADGTSYIRFTDESSGTSATDGAIFGLDGTNLYAWNYEAGDFAVATGGNPKFTVKNSGNCEIPDGNLVVANGHGIDFGSTTPDGTSVSNELLDDYEEGTWTATVENYTSSVTSTITNATGVYTKVGNVVTCSWYSSVISLSGSQSGAAQIGGLPFVSVNTTNVYQAANFAHTNSFAHTITNGYTVVNESRVVLVQNNSTSTTTWNTGGGNRYVMMQITYLTNS